MLSRSLSYLALLFALLLPLQAAVGADDPAGSPAASASNVADKPAGGAMDKPTPPGAGLASQEKANYAGAGKVLFELFALAVVLESALAVIFNWRPFLELFDARGVKTIVSVVAALVLVETFKLDLTTDLVRAFDPKAPPSGSLGSFLTALVIAGGSSGVNNLLVALGFRSMRSAEVVTPKPPPTKAWVSVRVERRKCDASTDVPKVSGALQLIMSVDDDAGAVIGTIAGKSSPNRLLRYFLRDRGRFPSTGGFVVEPGKKYRFTLADAKGGDVQGIQWGPCTVGMGAIVDIEFTVQEV